MPAGWNPFNVLFGPWRCPRGVWTRVAAGPSVWFFRRVVVTPVPPASGPFGVRVTWRAYLSGPPYYIQHFFDVTAGSGTTAAGPGEAFIGPFAVTSVIQIWANPNVTCMIEVT